TSTITAALAYASASADGPLVKLIYFLRMLAGSFKFPAGFLLFALAVSGFLLTLFRFDREVSVQARKLPYLMLMLISICLSIIATGIAYVHYLIQMFP